MVEGTVLGRQTFIPVQNHSVKAKDNSVEIRSAFGSSSPWFRSDVDDSPFDLHWEVDFLQHLYPGDQGALEGLSEGQRTRR